MTWQAVVVLQVIVSSLMTLYARKLTLKYKNLNYLLTLFTYLIVAVVGTLLALYFHGGSIPHLPTSHQLLLLVGVASFIPISWLLSFRLIGIIGASNGVIAGTIGYVTTAVFGLAFLHESISQTFLIGCLFLLVGTYLVFTIHPDAKTKSSGKHLTKLLLLIGATLSLATGLVFEKLLIGSMGVWTYSMYGWGSQFIGAIMLILIFGRQELKLITFTNARDGITQGLLVSVAGGLFIYALSTGSLSSTIMAMSAKLALTVILAAVFLHERNNMNLRISALAISLAGLFLIVK